MNRDVHGSFIQPVNYGRWLPRKIRIGSQDTINNAYDQELEHLRPSSPYILANV